MRWEALRTMKNCCTRRGTAFMVANSSLHAQIAAVLETAEEGDADVLDRLVPLVYEQLRAMAHRQLAREYGARTLQTTALVHEAYLRVADDSKVTRRGQSYFFAAAAREARKIVEDGIATPEDVDKAMITGRNWPAAFFGNRGGIGKQW